MEKDMDSQEVATIRADVNDLRSDMERGFNKVDLEFANMRVEIKGVQSSVIRWVVGLFMGLFTLTMAGLLLVASVLAGYAGWLLGLFS